MGDAKYCKKNKKECKKNKDVQEKCPMTCNMCDEHDDDDDGMDKCEDSDEKYCKKNKKQCKKNKDVQEKCPMTCNMCDEHDDVLYFFLYSISVLLIANERAKYMIIQQN